MSTENNAEAVADHTGKRRGRDFVRLLVRALTADLSIWSLIGQTIVFALAITLTWHFWLGPWVARHVLYSWLSQGRWMPLPLALVYLWLIGFMRHRSLMALHEKVRIQSKGASDEEKSRLKNQVDRKRSLYKMIGEVFAAMSVLGAVLSLVVSYTSFDARFLRPTQREITADLTRIQELTERTCVMGVPADICVTPPTVSQMIEKIEKATDAIEKRTAVTDMLGRLRPLLARIQDGGYDELARLLDNIDAAYPDEAQFSLLQMAIASFLVLTVTIAVGFKLAVAVYEYRITLLPVGDGTKPAVAPDTQRCTNAPCVTGPQRSPE
ncbi:hypothetical protein L2Y90_25975 [Burkholderia pyrrocinia]|uniref:hypothetical protein n=1 Tax=Burkholderia pyrrocinia TaxID=60550 RepID=UPI00215B6FC8|nr:hypothetical protein [Burkholderia pyrrocinia]UVE67579.1 hypothetical protein L2Y90_25975 [Burkholderia pyrrocinia]